jgi:UPF0755 protein
LKPVAKKRTKKEQRILKRMWTAVGVLLLVVAAFGFFILKRLYTPNVLIKDDGYVFVPTGSSFNDVVRILKAEQVLKDEETFRWTAMRMNYTGQIKPGRYRLKSGMGNRELVLLLRSGKQAPVRLTLNNIRTREQLAERAAAQLELKASSLLKLMNDRDYLAVKGFSPDNVLAMFLPDTYELYWNTSPDQFITRMKREYDKFWNQRRLKAASDAGLNPVQISVIASIVQQETNKEDEKPVIAGVYINRYRKDWKLEADPTLVYANGDFSINRVLNIHKSVDSPYNTYVYKGLPPGPICLPTQQSIDAVLRFRKHDYMYFCARDDFSGYHSFARTYSQHLENARRFQRAMDRRGIMQ